MPEEIAIPSQKLPKSIIKAMQVNDLIENAVILFVLCILWFLNEYFTWVYWIGWILTGILIVFIVSTIWSLTIRPYLVYKHTRYEVTAQYLQIKSGALIEKFELVPMTKVQAVETNQGPIMRKYGLCSISIKTLGSTHGIIGLEKEFAMELRNKIAHYAQLKEADS